MDGAADVGAGARQQCPVEPQAELGDAVARLDDPRDDARSGDPDELALLEDVDVVVELRGFRVECLREALDRPGLVGGGDHRLEDPEADRVGQRLQGFHVRDDALGDRLEGSLAPCRSSTAQTPPDRSYRSYHSTIVNVTVAANKALSSPLATAISLGSGKSTGSVASGPGTRAAERSF
jgi:hypothetical protein